MANAELISAAPTLLRELIAAQWGDRSRPDGGACPSCCGIRTVEHADGSGTGHHPSCTLAAAIVDATGEWPR